MNPIIDWAAILSILVLVVLAYLQLVFCLYYICNRSFREYINGRIRAEVCGEQKYYKRLDVEEASFNWIKC